jgi:hypothetical protein
VIKRITNRGSHSCGDAFLLSLSLVFSFFNLLKAVLQRMLNTRCREDPKAADLDKKLIHSVSIDVYRID